MDERVEPLPDAPEGTCVPAPEAIVSAGRDAWAVRGRLGWFRCNPHTSWCECAEFLAQKRRGQPLTPCAHLRALARHLAAIDEVEECLIYGALPTDAELRRLFS